MATNRYADAKITRDSNTNVRNYATMIFSNPPFSASDMYIMTRIGDRLDVLANRFYGDSTLWWIIGAANNLTDSFNIPPGTKIRIPNDVGYVLDYIRLVNKSR